ncbi:MAG: 50S ribosomal protein L18 [Candidatus Dojkabacteria bacterium]|nr:50S ribosomal protein L18 [Candidatus Dojkabacteria bacterium]
MKNIRIIRRERRVLHVRKKVFGTLERPRAYVYRSNKHIYIHLADDNQNRTMFGMSDKFIKEKMTPLQKAFKLGQEFGKKVLDKGFSKVVFDRRGYKYHGRVKALADGMRSAGVNF